MGEDRWKVVKALAACVAITGGAYVLFVLFEGEVPGSNKEFPQICTAAKAEAGAGIRCKPDCGHIPKETLQSLMAGGMDRASAERVLIWHKMYWRDACPKQESKP